MEILKREIICSRVKLAQPSILFTVLVLIRVTGELVDIDLGLVARQIP